MAKRKRLSPAQDGYLESQTPVLETKPMPLGRAPIAQVAGEASASAALQELAGEMNRARDEGRLIQALDECVIEAGYLVRDRMMAEDEELRVLMESLRARGQQTPIEVVALDGGRYGLISGWRRLTALRRLLAETGEDRFATVQAILRRPETAADAYVAMVEENEIRVGLSYYERARVAAKAVEQGVYEDEKQALLQMYSTASRAKRSKIRSFLTIYHAADDLLRFPMAIGERLGLALAKVLETDPTRAEALRDAVQGRAPETAETELELVERVVAEGRKASLTPASETIPEPETPMREGIERVTPAVRAIWTRHSLTLSGDGMTEAFRKRLFVWIRKNR